MNCHFQQLYEISKAKKNQALVPLLPSSLVFFEFIINKIELFNANINTIVRKAGSLNFYLCTFMQQILREQISVTVHFTKLRANKNESWGRVKVHQKRV